MNADPPDDLLPPLAALVPPSDGSNMLQEIPVEILKNILSYSDVPSLVLLAATSKHYRQFVFKDCPFLWQEISFENSPQAARLTDAELNLLLTNVNARNVTTSFSLLGCSNIRGYGLSALMYSKKLEIVELRKSREELSTVGETGLDDNFVIGILSTTAPINRDFPPGQGGLKDVKIRRQFESRTDYGSFSPIICDFIDLLHDARARQIREQRTTCSTCDNVLVDIIPNEDLDWRGAKCYCEKCKRFSCEENECNFIGECRICMGHFCAGCRSVFNCDVCDQFYCKDCRCVGHCFGEDCGSNYCEECKDTWPCTLCGKSWCIECRTVAFCMACGTLCCEKCRAAKKCNKCKCKFCSECDPVEHCSSCETDHCRGCGEKGCHPKKRKAVDESSEKKPAAKRSK